ncbi:uncharacterized protein LOC115880542 isoform X2 [Sitophilus oryzae]|uniref:Uncharacterized protein LOC115880542 isoform X2 n=1 Tax=Sitophilus oryzae TaxID=7048 RepID=A0A6J2XQH0_SITOR|nr:uncharacterized protein LOC115880542 isoform X2 [Sitophilus oryzae]
MQSSSHGGPSNGDLNSPDRKRKCSVAPNCGYLEINSNEGKNCQRRTCNYFWLTLEPRDYTSDSVSNLTNSIVECCTEFDDEEGVESNNKNDTPGTPRNSQVSDGSKSGSNEYDRTPRSSDALEDHKSGLAVNYSSSNKVTVTIKGTERDADDDDMERELTKANHQSLSEQQLSKSFSQFLEEYTPKDAAKPPENAPSKEYTPKVAAKPPENAPSKEYTPKAKSLENAPSKEYTPKAKSLENAPSKEYTPKGESSRYIPLVASNPTEDARPIKRPQCCQGIESTAELSESLISTHSKTQSIIKQEPSKHEVKPKICVAETCPKLNVGFKSTKTCCRTAKCPLNDMDSSTYKFITDVRMCCRKKACELAARICDIYEPLVKVEVTKSTDTGDSDYHYWGKDNFTYALKQEEPTNHQPPNTDFKKEEQFIKSEDYLPASSSNAIAKPKSSIILEELFTSKNEEEDDMKDSVYTEPERREKRTSVVSWSFPKGHSSNSVLKATTSEEQLVARATEAANMFRQAQQPAQGSIDEYREKPILFLEKNKQVQAYSDNSRDLAFKSQLDSIQSNSDYQTKCCSSLRNKLKRKKKRPKSSPSLHWAYNNETERRRPNIEDPVEEQQMALNDILNKV